MTASSTAPALIVLAAGMGSRFGGDKQVAEVGPCGETILDFTAYDARRAGFAEVVLVVRRDNQATVEEMVGARLARHLPVRYVFQDTAEPLPGLRAPTTRRKPWGTAHALTCALGGLTRPCGVVNADDWYSPQGISALGQALAAGRDAGVLVAYPLGRTLSAHGPVNRALCTIDAGRLTAIAETMGIAAGADGRIRSAAGVELAAAAPVSLNLWGFRPDFYAPFGAAVAAFIRANLAEATVECQLPVVAMQVVAACGQRLACAPVEADWTGLTYQADRPAVQARLAQATAAGEYPSPLWG